VFGLATYTSNSAGEPSKHWKKGYWKKKKKRYWKKKKRDQERH
jgi:hypothetical protein